ncbi:MaoC family dehydratase [Tepidibacter hydrothermalis]|uniref:MaoC family dehydratase n=1 Tax=Tepidibacter hydrothermalis TaxID=3036126 RepID=A0ABY8EFP9_9FIRM|nr:MaoC family dehydratase [Tepidibacter hydrothermalis]WFD10317.1 MaoC family dehydratase [Tepidibacter hydrothermalis]
MVIEKSDFGKFQVGYKDSFTREVTQSTVDSFVDVSGDVNPIHVNEEYAKTTRFKKRIAHGVISASFISSLVGLKMPGIGAIYVSQTLKFRAPVFIGDTLTVTGEVVERDEERKRIKIQTDVTNQDGVLVTTGHAVMMHE